MAEFDLLSETKACDLLARLFRGRGYKITRNIVFREYGVSFHIDGWDAKARVGFEFLSSEDEDHDDLTLREYQTLMAAQQRGELALLILDEVEPLSVTDLQGMANEFLDEVAAAATAQQASRRRTAGKSSGKNPSAKAPVKKAAAKVSAMRGAVKKPVKRVKKVVSKSGKKAATTKRRASRAR